MKVLFYVKVVRLGVKKIVGRGEILKSVWFFCKGIVELGSN